MWEKDAFMKSYAVTFQDRSDVIVVLISAQSWSVNCFSASTVADILTELK